MFILKLIWNTNELKSRKSDESLVMGAHNMGLYSKVLEIPVPSAPEWICIVLGNLQ